MFSMIHKTAVGLGAAALILIAAGGARAFPITYDFTVAATSGPLNGTVAHGTLSYDSSSTVPGGSISATGLLTSLSFSWNGVAYTQATANTGFLEFDADGTLNLALFGTHCDADGCSLSGTLANAFLADLVPGKSVPLAFIYDIPGDFGEGSVTASALPAPEPASLTLLVMGLAGLGMVLRTRRG